MRALISSLLASLVFFINGSAQAMGPAAGQLENALDRPDQTYDRSRARPDDVPAYGSAAASRRPSLKLDAPKPKDEVEVPSVQREDRAVTQKDPPPSKWGSKWVTMGASAALLGILGFIALGPWGLLGGALLGAASGWYLHGKFHQE